MRAALAALGRPLPPPRDDGGEPSTATTTAPPSYRAGTMRPYNLSAAMPQLCGRYGGAGG